MKAYQLKITIKDSHPPIWRRVIVPAGLSFSQLSVVLNEVMDWDGYHLFSFEFYNLGLRIEEIDEDYGFMDMDLDEASEVIIDAYLDREKRFTYVYDFGDDWRHAVVVEKIIEDYDKNYPVVLKYKGDSPIEDCGGIWGFYDKQRILENPEDSEYEEISEWAPFGVAVEFDLEEKNERLEALCLTNKKSKPMLQNEIYEDLLKKNKGFKLIQGVNEHIRDTDFDEFEQWDELAEAAEQLRQMEAYLEKLKSQVKNMYPEQSYNPENPTLKEIYQDYKKEHLVQMAKNHGLSGYSKFKKAELIDFLVYNVLDKDVMCRYFTFLSDEELAIIEKFSDPSVYKDATEEDLSNAMELFGGGYAGCHSLRDIIVPKEVLDAYKKNCDGEWRRLRREALELSYYLSAAAELYGICPMEKALEIYRKHTGKEADEIKLYGFCQSVPETRKCYMYNGIQIVHKAFIDEELFEELKEQQEGKPYYMPTKKEALTLGKDGYLPFDDSMKALESFLDIFFWEDPGYATYLCRFFQSIIRAGADIEEVVGFLEDNDVLGKVYDREAKAEFKQLLIKAWHRTRKMSERGNLPKGVTRQERNGGKLAVENSGKADVLKFPVDVQRKIYPNDPCPCGSGKKYKKCCGRNE